MKNIHLKSTIISAIIIWILGVITFITSYFIPIMADPNLQANWALAIAFIPFVTLGTHLYYRKGYNTNGFILGTLMFLIAMLLDAIITVPFLIMPYGGTYQSFFSDPFFWLLAVEYISLVVAYWQIGKALKKVQVTKS